MSSSIEFLRTTGVPEPLHHPKRSPSQDLDPLCSASAWLRRRWRSPMTCLPLPRRLLTHTSNHCRLRRSQLEVGIIGPTKEEGGDQPRIPRSVTNRSPPMVGRRSGAEMDKLLHQRSVTICYDEKLTVAVNVAPDGSVSKQSIEETRTALRELGLKDDLLQ
jgi:hypothetical protein